MDDLLLDIQNLSTAFRIDGQLVKVLDNVSFTVKRGESCALVGESGSGKSVTSKTIMRLIPDPPGKVLGGKILFEGGDILSYDEKAMYQVRGNKISMIFQEPMTSLNPVFTCGNQIMEPLMVHQHLSKKEAGQRAIEMLRLVGIQLPEKRFDAYPHELSGGMRQRVMIAMALACRPALLIADEPTTALDPTIQAQILRLIKDLKEQLDMSVLLVTHDLGMVAGNCTKVVVMYAGTVVEHAEVHELFKRPSHPYTVGLLKSMPRINQKTDKLYTIEGVVPPFTRMPEGCPFAPRCNQRLPICSERRPSVTMLDSEHSVRCWLYEGKGAV
jgi:peptide/nickel transport system ATP-binding protein/oligopeptide transport system ATP-binding protein